MLESDKTRISSHFERLLDGFGFNLQGLDYGRPESQRIRFEVLAEAIPDRDARLLDVGCGLGDYADFLAERRPRIVYSGVDLTEKMVAEARRLHPNLDLKVADILDPSFNEHFDVVTAIGIFYLLGGDAFSTARRLVRRMWELCGCVLAFSTLSTLAPNKQPGEFYADPTEMLRFCLQLTPWCVLRHDYLPHDFSVYMFREPRR
jgi:SAM-dependent methyltransferase